MRLTHKGSSPIKSFTAGRPGRPLLFDGDAVNDPPRYLVFTQAHAERAGLFWPGGAPPYARLCALAQGVVADKAAAQQQATELGGAVVRTPTGQLLWLDAEGRDAALDQAIAADERRWADERLARRGEVST